MSNSIKIKTTETRKQVRDQYKKLLEGKKPEKKKKKKKKKKGKGHQSFISSLPHQ